MEIIRHGKIQEQEKIFECKYCGCIFRANEKEYEENNYRNDSCYFCKCPTCDSKACEIKIKGHVPKEQMPKVLHYSEVFGPFDDAWVLL